jgi:hypothetical protein
MDRKRAGNAALRQMIHQSQKERQIARFHPLFVKRENVGTAFCVQQEIRILDALGNALVGQENPCIVVGEKVLELDLVDVRIDRHSSSPVDKGHIGLGEFNIPQCAQDGKVFVLLNGDREFDTHLKPLAKRIYNLVDNDLRS